MADSVHTRVDPGLCTGCGLCVRVCPAGTLALVAGKAAVTGTRSIQCGHCAAVCPVGAVTVEGLDAGLLAPESFEPGAAPPTPDGLLSLMDRRRSCRFYRPDAVAPALLRDLVRAGLAAPSGTNSQLRTFRMLPDRAAVEGLGGQVAAFFERLNRLSANPLARLWSRLFSGDALGRYYRGYRSVVRAALEEWKAGERDRLFHGAPAAILVGCRPGAATPVEDALLSAGQMILLAEALGLGTCLIGYAVAAFGHDPRMRAGLSPGERIHAVLVVGWPAVRYARAAGRPGRCRSELEITA